MFHRLLSILGAWATLGTTVVLAQVPPDSASAPAAVAAGAVIDVPTGAPAADGDFAQPLLADLGRAWRSALAAHGVECSGSVTSIWIGDVAGGMRTGGAAHTVAYAGVAADLGKLTGLWPGGQAFANVAMLRGRALSERFSGDALVASNLEGYASVRLYDAWIEQSFAGGRSTIRVGSQGADEEFTGTDGGALLNNSAFGWEAGIGANVVNGGPIFFEPALGVRVAATLAAGWSLHAGVYDGDAFDSPDGDPAVNAHGVHFRLSRSQGAFLIGEGVREWGREARVRRGCVRLGAWRHTADFADVLRDEAGASFVLSGLDPAVHHGNHGAYGSYEQCLWSEGHEGARAMAAWVRGAVAPADRSAYSAVGECGVRWTGPLPSRVRDEFAAGIVHARVSDDVRRAFRDAHPGGDPAAIPGFERVFEFAYQVRAGDHWCITPDVQVVEHPGTTAAVPTATIAGLRVSWQ